MERMQQLQIQGELLRSKVEVQLDEAEKEFQCVDREPELSNNSKGQGEREGESEGNYFVWKKAAQNSGFREYMLQSCKKGALLFSCWGWSRWSH